MPYLIRCRGRLGSLARATYQPLKLAPPASARVTSAPRLASDAITVDNFLRMLVLSSGLPALNGRSSHQKVPSSVADCTQPTIQARMVGCTTRSPDGPSAHIQPSDRSFRTIRLGRAIGVPKYYRVSTLAPTRLAVNMQSGALRTSVIFYWIDAPSRCASARSSSPGSSPRSRVSDTRKRSKCVRAATRRPVTANWVARAIFAVSS